MLAKVMASLLFVSAFGASCKAGEKSVQPHELEVLRSSLGVWDASIEVWPAGLDSASTKFHGVETNRAYGDYWIASDFDSEINGETLQVHSIVGYDLDRKKLVATVIDQGPHAASMTGDYNEKSKTVHWITKVKGTNDKLIVQKTSVTLTSPTERVLVLSVPEGGSNDYRKFMVIKFVLRTKSPVSEHVE